MPKTDVTVKLVGEDGNVFNIIGKVSRELKRAGFKDEAKQFQDEVFQCKNYDEVLQLVFKYVDVE